MSSSIASIGRAAAEAGVTAAWAQWSALGSAAAPSATGAHWTIVDPEALVLASVAFAEEERRLPDVSAGWAKEGARLLSIRRMRTLMAAYPEKVQNAARFAVMSLESRAREGRRRFEAGGDTELRSKPGGPLRLHSAAALMLRLRAAFSVGAKADILTFLLGVHGSSASVRALAESLAYTPRAVRTAAEEMALAGIVEEIDGPPLEYRASDRAWAQLLNLRRPGTARDAPPEIPNWRAWSAVYPFLAQVKSWAVEADASAWSEYVASSRARDVAEKHTPALRRAGISVPANTGRGAEYLDDFTALVQSVAAWAAENV